MKKGILIPVTSRTVEKKYHLRTSDIVQLSTDTHMLLRGIVMSDKGKGRYKVMVFDEVPDEVKDFELRPVRITEKSLLALHFVKEKVEGKDSYVLYDMAWEPKVGIGVTKWENGEETYHVVIGGKFWKTYLEYMDCEDDVGRLNCYDKLMKSKVTYIHEIQHLFSKITSYPLALMWDLLSDEYSGWQDEIETLYLSEEDGCGLSFNNIVTSLVMTPNEQALSKIFWIPEVMRIDELLAKFLFEDYDFVCFTTATVYHKRYKEVSFTRNGNTLTRPIKKITMSPPSSLLMPVPQSMNYINITLDEDDMTLEEKKEEWGKLGFDVLQELKDTESE